MSTTSNSWTEQRVYNLLGKVFPSDKGAYVLLPQVRNGTGYTRKVTRTADAVAFSCWPSRGLWMAGVEIKVSLQDWRKELGEPEKADSIQQYCKYWYVAAPEGVVPHGEVPETWGLIECHATGAKIVKAAPASACANPDMALIASVMRNLSGNMVAKTVHEAELESRAEELAAAKTKQMQYELDRLTKDMQEFEQASGVKVQSWSGKRIGEAVKAVLAGNDQNTRRDLENMMYRMRNTANDIIARIDREHKL